MSVVQQTIERDTRVVAIYAVRSQEQVFPARPQVPGHAPGRDRKIPPPVGNTQFAKVNESADFTVVQQHIRQAVITMTKNTVFRARSRTFELCQCLARREMGVLWVEVPLGHDKAPGYPRSDVLQRELNVEDERTCHGRGLIKTAESNCQQLR
jgi:hypothetical protein